MKVMITGALGHIGSALIEAVSNVDSIDEMILLDNMSTQRFPSVFNIQKAHQFYNIDLSVNEDIEKVDQLVQEVECVIHLAAKTDAASSFNDPKAVERNNFVATQNLAELCLRHKCKLIHISSTSVYGSQEKTVDEDCQIDELKPQSPYAESKLKEEKMLADFSEKGLNFSVFRFGTIYGKSIGMRFHTAVNKFCWQAAHNEEITVWRTALDQVRPYLYLADAVSALLHTINNDIFHNQIINIVSQNLTVRDITDEIAKYYPNVKIKLVDSPIMNQLSYDVKNERSLALGYSYSGTIEQGIEETLALFRNLKNKF